LKPVLKVRDPHHDRRLKIPWLAYVIQLNHPWPEPKSTRELAGCGLRSVVNWLNTTPLKLLKEVLHGFERFRGVPCQSVISPVDP